MCVNPDNCYIEIGIDLLKTPLQDIGGGKRMLYPFMTLEDETEIVHSEPLTVDGKEKVKEVIEQPVTGGFHSAVCWLPDYTWEKIEGFSKEEINQYQVLIESVSREYSIVGRLNNKRRKRQ